MHYAPCTVCHALQIVHGRLFGGGEAHRALAHAAAVAVNFHELAHLYQAAREAQGLVHAQGGVGGGGSTLQDDVLTVAVDHCAAPQPARCFRLNASQTAGKASMLGWHRWTRTPLSTGEHKGSSATSSATLLLLSAALCHTFAQCSVSTASLCPGHHGTALPDVAILCIKDHEHCKLLPSLLPSLVDHDVIRPSPRNNCPHPFSANAAMDATGATNCPWHTPNHCQPCCVDSILTTILFPNHCHCLA